MIPLAANIPLTLCSVVLRRFFDSYAGRLPLAVTSSSVPTASTVALLSGALVCLYHQFRKGTLVKIGLGKGISSIIRNSRHTIQRRVKTNSWFLRNINSCRRKCAEAVFKIVHSPNSSLDHLQTETGTIETGIVGESTSLPVFSRRFPQDNRRIVALLEEPPLENLYSNESFDSNDYSTQDVRKVVTVKSEKRRRSKGRANVSNRPLTRNFRKSMGTQEICGDGRRLSSKKRKKDPIITDPPEDDHYIMDVSRPEEKKQTAVVLTQKVPAASEGSTHSTLREKRHLDRLRRLRKIQKITSKTRSGRVYAYRL